MKNSERGFLSAGLAALPLLHQADSFNSALRIAGVVVFIFWLTAFFFKLSRPLFPQKLLGISIILWTAAWMEAAQTHFGRAEFTPLCSLSLLLLLGPYFAQDLKLRAVDPGIKATGSMARCGLGFLILVTSLGTGREIFRRSGTQFFDQPAGVLFLIALAGWLWQNQPGSRRSLGLQKESGK